MSFDLSKCERNAQGHWLCQTKSGRPCRIICNDRQGDCPLVALQTVNGMEEIYTYQADGSYMDKNHAVPLDLVNTPRKFRLERWVNVYSSERSILVCTHSPSIRDIGLMAYPSKETADTEAAGNRIACVKVVIEGEYGQGLEGPP